MSSYSVYRHTCPNGKVYIGITGRDPVKRWENGKKYAHNKHFAAAISKYGWDNILHEILYTGLTKAEAEQIEMRLIFLHNSRDRIYGYNTACGGSASQLGRKRPQSEKEKISRTCKNSPRFKTGSKRSAVSRRGKPVSDDTRAKISAANKGKGRSHSDESRKKISESLKGRTLSPEHRAALSAAAKRRSAKV